MEFEPRISSHHFDRLNLNAKLPLMRRLAPKFIGFTRMLHITDAQPHIS